MPDSEPPRVAQADPSARSLPDDLRQLAADARVLAKAELAYQKSRAAFAGDEAKRIAVFGALAAVLAFFALMALTLGLVLALTPILTAWGATAVVVVVLLVAAGTCALMASGRWKRMTSLLSEGGDR